MAAAGGVDGAPVGGIVSMTPRGDRPIRVLFLHGLEGHPNGSKVRAMRAQGIDVRAPDLKMGVLRWRRENAVIRQFVRLGEVRLVSSVLLIGLLAMSWDARSGLVSVGALAWMVGRWRALFSAALHRSFDACVDIARAAVTASDVDVLVGSSWGGAVAGELIGAGAWVGPTVLLAPAMAKVHRRAGIPDGAARIAAFRASGVPVLVFHDPADAVVPHADSVVLAEGAAVELRSVDAGGHRLLGLLDDGRLVSAIGEVVGPRPESVSP